MQYVLPTNTPAHVQHTSSPYNPWRPFRTRKLLRFSESETCEKYFIFEKDKWKLAVVRSLVWKSKIELIMGRKGTLLFLLEVEGSNDVVQMTDPQGQVRRTIRYGDADYKEYLNILTHGGGKDPYDHRT